MADIGREIEEQLTRMREETERQIARMREETDRQLGRIDRMAAEMEQAREVGRDVVFGVVLLSAAIVAFSATLLSIKNLKLDVDARLLQGSWVLFAIVVFVGPVAVFLESRAHYAVTWRAHQAMNHERRRSTRTEKAQLLGLVLYTLFVRPRNLIFVRDTDYGDEQKAWLNARAVRRLHLVWDVALALELVFWLCFTTALAVLVASFVH